MLQPRPDETQPQFAIRFHGATEADIPDVYERNAACDQAWEATNGVLTERQIAQDYFSPDEYEEVRDIFEFEEHSVPDSTSKSGEVIPGTYDKYALAEMCEGMNTRIRDTELFNPLSKGHTSKGADSPDLLGFGGAKRLAMCGRENPRFAIVTDEYRRKDKLDEFRTLPGRSPEVWKYKKFSDRFFAPTACLRAETPRLNMPLAKYSLATSVDGDDFPVDRYERTIPSDISFDDIDVEIDCYMSAMGGANSFVPGAMGQQSYGQPQQQDVSEAEVMPVIEQILNAVMQSQQMQWVTQQMGSEAAGMAKPAVQQPVEPVDELPGQQQQLPPDPGDMEQDIPPDDMGGAMDQQASQQGFPTKGQYQMEHVEKEQYARDLEALKAEKKALEDRLASLEGESQTEKYERQLDQLADSVIFNRETELTRLQGMSPDAAETHLNVIRENYARSVNGIDDFDTVRGPGQGGSVERELTAADVEQITQYAMEHGTDYAAARSAVIAGKQS